MIDIFRIRQHDLPDIWPMHHSEGAIFLAASTHKIDEDLCERNIFRVFPENGRAACELRKRGQRCPFIGWESMGCNHVSRAVKPGTPS